MRRHGTLLIILIMLLSANVGRANLDSLLAIHQKEGVRYDSVGFWRLIDITSSFQQQNFTEASKYARLAIEVAEKSDMAKWQLMSYNMLAIMNAQTGNAHQAKAMFEKCLTIDSNNLSRKNLATIQNNIGLSAQAIGEYGEAITHLMKGLRIRETLDFPLEIAGSLNNIGLCYQGQRQYDIAIEYYNKSLAILIAENDTLNDLYSSGLNNIGQSLDEMFKHSEALPYYLRAVKIDVENGFLHSASYSYNYLGDAYAYMNEWEKAHESYQAAKEINIQLDDPFGLEMSNVSIAICYIDQKQYSKSIDLLKKAISFYIENDDLTNHNECLKHLSTAYAGLNQWEQAFIYSDSARKLTEKLHNVSFTSTIADIQGKYNYDKQRTENEMLAKELELDNAKLSKAKEKEKSQALFIWIIGIALGAALILITMIALSLSRKRKANKIISDQRDLAEEQKKIIHLRSLEIEEKHQEITDSINYGKRIQDALLTSEEYWASIASDFFILFEPKDIVSGDFHWAYIDGDTAYWVVADCTGHGVPGAFMSMLGIGFLNEIIIENQVSEPAEILNQLRTKIINSLDNKDQEIQARDGMDIALCRLNRKTRELSYSGANNGLWIVRHGKTYVPTERERTFEIPETENQLIEILADKQPVGSYGDILESFTTKSFTLQKGDRVYTFSDGYADQFGGSKGKKMKPKTLKSLLLGSQKTSLKDQRELLLSTLTDWKQDFEQVDDICIVGVEI